MVAAVAAKLAEIAPARVVTRTYMDFSHRKESDLSKGVFTLLSSGVKRYPTDYIDSGDNDPAWESATALPVFAFRVLGQGVLAESADGVAIEAAEFSMLAQIEALANALVKDETLAWHGELVRAVLKGVDQSNQLEAPYYWIAALFELEIT